jgi:AraC family transcriptional regulator of adaptative response/methylated-DNA-[protein]-cysteine methyltransferase
LRDSVGDDPDKLVRDLQDQFPNARLVGADRRFEQLIAQVVGFVEAPALGLDLPLDLRGTAFQERVWQALREIPVGSTASYAQIAQRIGAPTPSCRGPGVRGQQPGGGDPLSPGGAQQR